MASTVFPIAASASSSSLGDGMVLTAGTPKKVTKTFPAGGYTLSCISSTVAYAIFYSNNTEVGRTKTVSGTITYSLPSAADQALFSIDTGTSISVSLTQTSNTQAGSTGTIQTLTTSGNLAAGSYYLLVIGAGGSGGATNPNDNPSGGAGASGGMVGGYLTLNSTTAYTIGAASNSASGSGGATTISNLTANGGTGGGYYGGPAGTPGTPSGGVGPSGLVVTATNAIQALSGNTIVYGQGGAGASYHNSPGYVVGGNGVIYALAL